VGIMHRSKHFHHFSLIIQQKEAVEITDFILNQSNAFTWQHTLIFAPYNW
jgi:hypothetical protein